MKNYVFLFKVIILLPIFLISFVICILKSITDNLSAVFEDFLERTEQLSKEISVVRLAIELNNENKKLKAELETAKTKDKKHGQLLRNP